MAFDGVMTAALVKELNETLTGGRIVKIAQPEKDELQLQIKNYNIYKLLISADASLPLLYLTEETKQSPITAPSFCMLLRKHFNSARILSVSQPGLERIVDFTVEHLNELGDTCIKHIIVELMGKHSNIILTDDQNKILDSIKRVSGMMSSVREVLPGRPYFIPQTQDKLDPLTVSAEGFLTLKTKPMPIQKALYQTFTGISPQLANELCALAGLDPDLSATEYSEDIYLHLFRVFGNLMDTVKTGNFSPVLIKKGKEPVAFSPIPLSIYQSEDFESEPFASPSLLLSTFYAAKNSSVRMKQRSSDLRRVISTVLEREVKKGDLQEKQLKDTESRDKYRVYGELLTTYGYQAEPGAKSFTTVNYYTGEDITIPLDPSLSALDCAKRYYERYSKLKRTYEALLKQTAETKEAILHLLSIQNSLEMARSENDLYQIKKELSEFGYLKKHLKEKKDGGKGKKEKAPAAAKPLHYRTEDGFDLYVGRNNYQNDSLTFDFANGNDWWFHIKDSAGSHVILKNDGREIPDKVFNAAGSLAAYYSKNKDLGKTEVDYVERKQVKKPNGAKPGFVVYYTNYSMVAIPDISSLTEIIEKEGTR